jgi:glycosyltransferase involved in cell wall biosynthesis
VTLLLDGRALQDRSSVRGIGTYLRELLAAYSRMGLAGQVSLMTSRGAGQPSEVAAYSLSPHRVYLPSVKRRLQPLADPILVAAALRRHRPALYHGVEFAQPLASPCPVVITVHDLIPMLFPAQYPWLRRERLLAVRQLRHADAIIADSQNTARDVERLGHVDPARIHVVPLGVAGHFAPASVSRQREVRRHFGLGERRFVLAVGTFDPRKRADLLADVIGRIRADADVDLVVVGDQGEFGATLERHLRPAAGDHLHLLGHVTTDDLIALYGASECLLFTSAYEGFGLPPLEANNSSLPEIAGPASLLAPDGDAGAMAGQVLTLLAADAASRTARRDHGMRWARSFEWERTARMTVDVYQSLLSERIPQRPAA